MSCTEKICKYCMYWNYDHIDDSYAPCKHPDDDAAFANWGNNFEIGTREDFGCNRWEQRIDDADKD